MSGGGVDADRLDDRIDDANNILFAIGENEYLALWRAVNSMMHEILAIVAILDIY